MCNMIQVQLRIIMSSMILTDQDHNGRKRDEDVDTLEYKNAMRK